MLKLGWILSRPESCLNTQPVGPPFPCLELIGSAQKKRAPLTFRRENENAHAPRLLVETVARASSAAYHTLSARDAPRGQPAHPAPSIPWMPTLIDRSTTTNNRSRRTLRGRACRSVGAIALLHSGRCARIWKHSEEPPPLSPTLTQHTPRLTLHPVSSKPPFHAPDRPPHSTKPSCPSWPSPWGASPRRPACGSCRWPWTSTRPAPARAATAACWRRPKGPRPSTGA